MQTYNSEQYKNLKNKKIIFEENDIFVVEVYEPTPIGKHWAISDGDVMFSVGEMPKLDYKHLVKEIAEYKFDKSQDVDDDGFDEDYEHEFTEEVV